MKYLHLLLTAGAFTVASVSGQIIATGINNGGFEDDDSGDPPSGWSLNEVGGSITVSDEYAFAGSNSLAIDSTGAGDWAVPNAFQSFPATPGAEYSLSGYMFMPDSDPITDASFGIFKIEFQDSGGTILDVAGLVTTGTAAGGPFFGAESDPQLNSGSASDTWVFSEAVVTAPAGAASVGFYLLNVNQGINPTTIYFDSVTAIPEPATFALIGGLLALGLVMYRRRRRA